MVGGVAGVVAGVVVGGVAGGLVGVVVGVRGERRRLHQLEWVLLLVKI